MPPLTREQLIGLYGPPDDLSADGKPNRELAMWALDAVNTFAKHSHNNPAEQHYELEELDESDAPGQGIASELIGDLICDLLHLAVLCGIDPDETVETGRRHFLAEVGKGYD